MSPRAVTIYISWSATLWPGRIGKSLRSNSPRLSYDTKLVTFPSWSVIVLGVPSALYANWMRLVIEESLFLAGAMIVNTLWLVGLYVKVVTFPRKSTAVVK